MSKSNKSQQAGDTEKRKPAPKTSPNRNQTTKDKVQADQESKANVDLVKDLAEEIDLIKTKQAEKEETSAVDGKEETAAVESTAEEIQRETVIPAKSKEAGVVVANCPSGGEIRRRSVYENGVYQRELYWCTKCGYSEGTAETILAECAKEMESGT